MADLNPNQFLDDDENPAKWQHGDRIKMPGREVTFRSGKTIQEPGREYLYAGLAAGRNHITVYDHQHPDFRGLGASDNSLVQKSLRVFKDGRVRHHKDAEHFKRVRDDG